MARGRKPMGTSKARKIATTLTIAQLEEISERLDSDKPGSEDGAGRRATIILDLLRTNRPEWFSD